MANLPAWLVDSRENVLKTQEWHNLTTNIYDAVDQHLAQSHVQYFTDLSDAEKSLVLERAARSLKGTVNGAPTPYDNLNKRVSDLLDKGVNNDVSRSLLKDDPLETKTDIILNKVCEGIVGLLRKWPDQKYKLHAFLNQSLPQPIRFVGWNLYLSNANHRQKFINDLANNPRNVLSPMDADIQRNCDSLVRTLPLAPDMMDSKGNMSAMKAILSYFHSLLSNKRDLADSEYYYVIPIVLSHNPPLSSFFPFSLEALFSNITHTMINKYLGCLTTDPLLFVWDQYLITSDIPKFHDELIPAIAAAMIITLRDFLLKCKMTSEMETVLQHKTNIIITRQLQSVIVRFFLADFKNRISRSDFGPVIDPTEGRQWTSFNRDHIPQAANRPEQRLTDRERNEQNAQLERRLREEMIKRQETERTLQTKIDQLQREIDNMKYTAVPLTTTQSIRAPTPAERYVNPRSRPVSPLKQITRKQQGNSPLHDLLRKISQTCNRVAHGEGKNSVTLNEQTKNDIRVHKLDLKMAEREVVGRTLHVNEWNQLPEAQKQTYSQQMLDVVKIRIQNRYSDGRK
ncbi:unnamed protein product [Rotaria sp. Silwood1]|nr:unnamed protein product [Rotaria sp. Silwood1]